MYTKISAEINKAFVSFHANLNFSIAKILNFSYINLSENNFNKKKVANFYFKTCFKSSSSSFLLAPRFIRTNFLSLSLESSRKFSNGRRFSFSHIPFTQFLSKFQLVCIVSPVARLRAPCNVYKKKVKILNDISSFCNEVFHFSPHTIKKKEKENSSLTSPPSCKNICSCFFPMVFDFDRSGVVRS